MRRFYLDRQTDVSGTSGTGAVVEGVELSNGQCVVRWLTYLSSLSIYASLDDVLQIHGHDGSTNLHWVDEAPSQAPTSTERPGGWQPGDFPQPCTGCGAIRPFGTRGHTVDCPVQDPIRNDPGFLARLSPLTRLAIATTKAPESER